MSLAGLLTILDDDPQLRNAVSQAEREIDPIPATGPGAIALAGEDLIAPPSLRPVLAAALTGPDQSRFVLAVTATAREADDLTAALGSFLPASAVAAFPGWETLPHERLSPQSDTVRPAHRRATPAGPPGEGGSAERAARGGGGASAEPVATHRGRAR